MELIMVGTIEHKVFSHAGRFLNAAFNKGSSSKPASRKGHHPTLPRRHPPPHFLPSYQSYSKPWGQVVGTGDISTGWLQNKGSGCIFRKQELLIFFFRNINHWIVSCTAFQALDLFLPFVCTDLEVDIAQSND